jgi:hypothetical protein
MNVLRIDVLGIDVSEEVEEYYETRMVDLIADFPWDVLLGDLSS